MINLSDIEAAAGRLQGHLMRTPCVASRTLSDITEAQIFLKFENLQFTASFKERGACNKLAQFTPQERQRVWSRDRVARRHPGRSPQPRPRPGGATTTGVCASVRRR